MPFLRPRFAVAFLLVAAWAAGQTPAPSFSKTVILRFDQWDANHDGTLEAKEIDRAALDPQSHGANAAALSALHQWLSAAKESPRLTKAWFTDYRPKRRPRAPKGASPAEIRALRKAWLASPDCLQATFAGAVRRISSAPSALFSAEGPALPDIRQGQLGNCYMLAPLGAMVHRDPSAVKEMIRPTEGGYVVRFGDGKEVRIAPPTDTEIGMGGSSTKSGLWVRVLEKAFGSRDIAEGAQNETIARDDLQGGSTARAARSMSGKTFQGLRLVGSYRNAIPEAEIGRKVEQLRKELPSALGEHRLVLASTPKKTVPKSIDPNHAYAVFGFDAATDRITLWNPHGNDFSPKGEEGYENGWRRQGGVFSMPLDAFVRSFGRIYFEQD